MFKVSAASQDLRVNLKIPLVEDLNQLDLGAYWQSDLADLKKREM